MLCSQVMQEDVPDEDAENAGKGGCGLAGNLVVAICRADWHLHRSQYQVATSPRTLHQKLGLTHTVSIRASQLARLSYGEWPGTCPDW